MIAASSVTTMQAPRAKPTIAPVPRGRLELAIVLGSVALGATVGEEDEASDVVVVVVVVIGVVSTPGLEFVVRSTSTV